MFFVFQPEFHFPTQIMRIFAFGAKKAISSLNEWVWASASTLPGPEAAQNHAHSEQKAPGITSASKYIKRVELPPDSSVASCL